MIYWSTTGIICSSCPKGNDVVRQIEGCRKLDPEAKSNIPHAVLDGTALFESFDYCPGLDASSPAVEHAWSIRELADAGYSLGDASSALAADSDILLYLRAALRAAESMVG